jgi:hypothetical protein
MISELFTAHEIDLNTFLTLSEADLQHLGVDKFGPRRKMGTIIMGKLSNPFISYVVKINHHHKWSLSTSLDYL